MECLSVAGWHLARPSIPLIVNYSQNMELGHFGQAGVIIKLQGEAQMHFRDREQPCQQLERVAFKDQSATLMFHVCVWNAVTWQSGRERPLLLFINVYKAEYLSWNKWAWPFMNDSPFLLLENMINNLKWCWDEEGLSMEGERMSPCQNHQS